jgi:hypothetical protein
LAANFSPSPRIAPPPLGSETAGAEKLDVSAVLLFSCRACGVVLSVHLISLVQTPYQISVTKMVSRLIIHFLIVSSGYNNYKNKTKKVNIVTFFAKPHAHHLYEPSHPLQRSFYRLTTLSAKDIYFCKTLRAVNSIVLGGDCNTLVL